MKEELIMSSKTYSVDNMSNLIALSTLYEVSIDDILLSDEQDFYYYFIILCANCTDRCK